MDVAWVRFPGCFYVISCRGGDLTDISQGRAEKNDEQISKVEQQQECHKLLLGIFYPDLLVYWEKVKDPWDWYIYHPN